MRTSTLSSQTARLWELIKDIHTAVLTTTTTERYLRSRPMATLQQEFHGDLWFFTNARSHKVEEIRSHPQVNVNYSDFQRQIFISMSGIAKFSQDRDMMHVLWDDQLKTWFPDALRDPDLTLMCVSVERAEQWNTFTGGMTEIFRSDVGQPGGNANIYDENTALI